MTDSSSGTAMTGQEYGEGDSGRLHLIMDVHVAHARDMSPKCIENIKGQMILKQQRQYPHYVH